jgi:hypothetical protein
LRPALHVGPGDLLVLGVESIEEALAFLRPRLDGGDRPASPGGRGQTAGVGTSL